MEILFELGISDSDINNMLEQCPDIMDMEYNEIREKIDILRYIECNDRHIRNIIVSNPYYLDRINNDILKLIMYLKEIGISCINLLLETNPYLLNRDVFEIREYIDSKKNMGLSLWEIVDEFESNPYIIDEM